MDTDSELLSGWAFALVAGVVITALIAVFGMAGCYVATRRARQPFVGFIVRYAVAFLSLLLLEGGFLWLVPSVHRGMQHLTALISSVGRWKWLVPPTLSWDRL